MHFFSKLVCEKLAMQYALLDTIIDLKVILGAHNYC